MSLDFKTAHEGLGFRSAPPEPPKPLSHSYPTSRALRDPFKEMNKPSIEETTEPLWVSVSAPPLKIETVTHNPARVPTPIRVTAFLVDTFLITGVFTFGLLLTTPIVRSPSYWLARPELLGMTALFILLFQWTLTTAQEILMSTTLGKKMFGLQIQGSPLQILVRAFLFIPSFLLAGTGLIWSFFEKDGHCWHDLASGAPLTRLENSSS